MRNIHLAVATLTFLAVIPFAALAAPDTYIGDAAIYSALDTGGDRPKPHVLLLIDTSRATLNSASGVAYDPSTVYAGSYSTWGVYFANNQGTFPVGNLVKNSADANLSGISCSTTVVKSTLLASGTYSGSGTVAYPSLVNNGNSAGACRTGNNAADAYALGNFLNYLTSSPVQGENQSQREIIYNALAQVVDGARFAVKFAAMTYNPNNQGGFVAYGMSDLSNDTTFNAFKAALPGPGENQGASLVNSQTNRPQSEALYDAGYYLGALYPTSGTISSDALFPLPNNTFTRQKISSHMPAYNSDNRNECQYNHIILITNGLPNNDGGANSPHAKLVDADGDGRADEQFYGSGTHFLDDVAAYLYKQERIVTHSILAFQNSDPLIERAAQVGGGEFHNVYNANELAEALTKLLASIVLEADTSFVAPVVPASSTNRTISSNRVYLGLFKPQNDRPWLGNLKKYGVSSDLTLLDKDNAVATDQFGDFLPNSKSYWGANNSGEIMSIDGLLTGTITGDGGNVAAGGVGGTLVLNLQAGLAATPSKQAWETRKIYTWPTGSLSTTLTHADNRFSPNNAKITAGILDVEDAERTKLIDFVAGADGYDDNNDGNTTSIRDWVLGDILHSKPLIYNYSTYTEAQETDCNANTSMIYVGSNDGMFHAFKDCDGSEAWAFIPPNVLPNLKYLRENEHYYFADASPTAYVHDVNNNNIIETNLGDKVILIFGQGRGGGRNTLNASGSRGAYYALDVSNPAAPVLLWQIDSTTNGFGELGQTWSPPRLARVKVGNEQKVVAFVGAGYDNNEDLRFGNNMLFPNGTSATTDTTLPIANSGSLSSSGSSNPFNPRGRGLFAIEIASLAKDNNDKYQPNFSNSGSLVWSFVRTESNGMDYSIPSDLTVLDMNGDGFQDRIYVGDTGGRLWRFDVGSNNTADWTTSGRMIFKSNKDSETYKGRKIFYRPVVALVNGIPTLYFGTGDRSHPLNAAVTDRMFAVKDRGQSSAKDIDDLVDLTANRLQASDATAEEIELILSSLGQANKYGWYVDLDQNAGEKVLASALVFNKQVFYTTYMPLPADNLDPCQVGNLGISRVYHLDYATAEAVHNYFTGNDSSTAYANNLRAKGGDGIALQRQDRVRDIGVGIPSGIVTLIDASGKVTLLISSSNRVGTYQAPDARMMTPLYWVQY